MLAGKTLFITGGSRGIGRAIALRAARDGANVVIAAKTSEPHAVLEGTIHSTAADIEAAGGRALAVQCDIRDEAQIKAAVDAAVARFGGIDMLVNNASAVWLAGTLDTPLKRYDLMQDVNTRGTFAVSQACLPHLLKAENPHILMLSPPLNMEERWFAPHVAYTIAKYGMSLCVLGMAGEFRGRVGVNALWPRTAIETAAMRQFKDGPYEMKHMRSPEIIADAAHIVLTSDARTVTGNFFVDDALLARNGVADLSRYNPPGVADMELSSDVFVPSLRELEGVRHNPVSSD